MFWRSQHLKSELQWLCLPSLVPTCNRASHVCLPSWKFLFPHSFGVCGETVSHCPDQWHRTIIFHFKEAWGSLAVVTRRTGRKDRMRGSSLNEAKAPRLELGIPSLVWLVVFSVGEPESWDVPMSYFLLSFALGSALRLSFHPMLAVIPLLPELLRLGGRQLSFNWRSQVQALVLANIHPAAESLRMTLNPLLLTLHTDLPVKRGKNNKKKKKTGGTEFLNLSISCDSHLVTEWLNSLHSGRKLLYSTLCFQVF